MSKLNERQREAAEFTDGICAVIAVPGSGKTRTMTERIGLLVKCHNVAPENILGLTFTRNAAEEMRSRLVPVLEDKAERVMLNTIHSFCLYFLKREGKVFELLTGKEQIIFIRDIVKKLKIKEISTGMVIREISLAKNNLITIEEFRNLYEGDKTMLQVADIAESYEREKKKKLLFDFDDLLFEVYTLLRENIEIRDKYREIYRHCLVDEFQDTNPLQMEIIKLLVDGNNGNGSFWVCGDDAQSIYSFTGASVSNIVGFQEMFPDSKLLILNLNYRSTQKIVTASQNLINHNVRKIDKTLETHNPDGDDLIVLECISEEDEALQVLTEIRDLVEQGYEHKDIAVLYRANFQSRVIEECFSQHKIPYHIENGMSFYNRREIRLLLDYLRVIHDPDSDGGDEALVNILNVPNRYISRKFVTELKDYASNQEMHLYEALKSMPVELPYVKKNVKEFISFLDPLIRDVAGSMVPSEVIQLLRDTLDYDKYITEDEIPSPDDVKISNINQLMLASARFSTIESFLNYTETFEEESSDDRSGVVLMTIHKSKGLEFPIIFVVGLVEGILPNRSSENVEEERRICFVSISRAMNLLYLSYSHTYLSQPAKKSIFIDEILGTKEAQ